MKTVRRLCRVCTSVCGILVDVDDDLGDRLRAVVEEHGPASVGIFFGGGDGLDAAGYRMAQALHGAIGHGHQDVNVNRLTSKDDLDPITGMATHCAIPVTLEPAGAGRG